MNTRKNAKPPPLIKAYTVSYNVYTLHRQNKLQLCVYFLGHIIFALKIVSHVQNLYVLKVDEM